MIGRSSDTDAVPSLPPAGSSPLWSRPSCTTCRSSAKTLSLPCSTRRADRLAANGLARSCRPLAATWPTSLRQRLASTASMPSVTSSLDLSRSLCELVSVAGCVQRRGLTTCTSRSETRWRDWGFLWAYTGFNCAVTIIASKFLTYARR